MVEQLQPAVEIKEIGYVCYPQAESFYDALSLATCYLAETEGECFPYRTEEAAVKDANILQQIMTAFGYPLEGLKVVQMAKPCLGCGWAIKLRSKFVRFHFEAKKGV